MIVSKKNLMMSNHHAPPYQTMSANTWWKSSTPSMKSISTYTNGQYSNLITQTTNGSHTTWTLRIYSTISKIDNKWSWTILSYVRLHWKPCYNFLLMLWSDKEGVVAAHYMGGQYTPSRARTLIWLHHLDPVSTKPTNVEVHWTNPLVTSYSTTNPLLPLVYYLVGFSRATEMIFWTHWKQTWQDLHSENLLKPNWQPYW